MAAIRILFVSALGESTDLWLRAQEEGHDVRAYVHAPAERACGDGMVRKVAEWRPWVRWADLVVVDDVAQKIEGAPPFGGGAWAKSVRAAGRPCVGGSPDTDRMEDDREFGMGIARRAGLHTVKMERFRGPGAFAAARKFVAREGGGWALKHNGQAPRDLGTVQFDPKALDGFLEWLETAWPDLAHGLPIDFVLQEAVKGVEIAVTGLFDGQRWRGAYVNQEVKKLMAGDEGPATGQTGEIGLPDSGRLFREALQPLTSYLRGQGYRGCLDLNCIATKGRLVPLEWTARFGYPTVSSLVEMIRTPVADWLHAAATGEGEVRWHPGYCATVVVASGPFPREDEELAKHIVLLPDDRIDWQRVHLNEVRMNAQGQYESAGLMGYMAVLTARGRGAVEARRACYAEVDRLTILPYRIVRRDIGDKWAKSEPQLREWGWLD